MRAYELTHDAREEALHLQGQLHVRDVSHYWRVARLDPDTAVVAYEVEPGLGLRELERLLRLGDECADDRPQREREVEDA